MTYETLTIDTPLPRVARITLDRPPVNALGSDLVRELAAAARELDAPDLCCVLVAARHKAFCAGADLKERAGKRDEEVLAHNQAIREAVEAVAAIPVPTVAVIHGAALGGGFELALACDVRIAADTAKVGLPETALAILPGAGGTQRMAWLAGPGVASRWILSARKGTAAEALADRLVENVVPAADLEGAALALAAEIAACGPVALRAAKRAIRAAAFAPDLASALAAERAAYLETLNTEDRREALAAFAEKRAPVFRGK